MNIPQRFIRSTILLAIVMSSIVGCSKPERPAELTFPVTGELVPNGIEIPNGTRIEFIPVSNANKDEYTAVGYFDAQGKFSLKIPYVDRVLPGALEGAHTVRIVRKGLKIQWTGEDSGIVPISGDFVVKPTDKPGENHFKITVPKKL
jgi:hypothetical protein